MHFNKNLLFRRAVALYIDLGITTLVSMIAHLFVSKFINVDQYSFVMLLVQLLMICRDIFGRSIGKKCAGLYIVNHGTNDKAKLSQRILRNVTGPVIIVEIFAILLREDHRRFGDLLAKTDVCHKTNKNKGLLK